MTIKDVLFTKSYTGFYFDDQKAIKGNAKKDGFIYVGDPVLEGFQKVRQPGEAISIQLILDDGQVAYGDCAAVQYSGAGGRHPLFLADTYIPFMNDVIKGMLIGEKLDDFVRLAAKYDRLSFSGKSLHTAIRYGLTQALLMAVALVRKQTMAEVIRDAYNPDLKRLLPVPIFAQTGDDRYTNVDKMILKEVDSLPHALINNVAEKLGTHGEILFDYVGWLRNRIIRNRMRDDYNPIIHIDVYGTLGIAFENDIDKIVAYIETLTHAAKPFALRLEGPIDTGDREGTMKACRHIRKAIDDAGIKCEIVADEWCNTLEDIRYFAENKAGHVLQIKTPDLGGLNNMAEAVMVCKENN
ncbi:MAG: methylaspartate ammonia-lyase, partial [Acholeplasmataceae bacterium]|nr:methylaspartate ammonia-lyase [Acholeplasmataceae bacterium]